MRTAAITAMTMLAGYAIGLSVDGAGIDKAGIGALLLIIAVMAGYASEDI